jgi:hypothetical protein
VADELEKEEEEVGKEEEEVGKEEEEVDGMVVDEEDEEEGTATRVLYNSAAFSSSLLSLSMRTSWEQAAGASSSG